MRLLAIHGLVAAGLVACGASAVSKSATSASMPRPPTGYSFTPRAPVGTDCYFRATYGGGTVLLDFSNRNTDCSTLRNALTRSGPPFTGSITPLERLNLGGAPASHA